MKMKKIILLIALVVGLTLTLSAGKASALTTASSVVVGDIFLDTLLITTTGSVTYGDFHEVLTHAYADTVDASDVSTEYAPPDTTTYDATTFNETEAGVPGAYYGVAKYDPPSMFAELEVYADDLGNDAYAEAWNTNIGMIYGGAYGGDITISFDYQMSIDLNTSSTGDYAQGYSSVGFSFATFGDGTGAWTDLNELVEEIWLDAWNGDDIFDVISGTLTLTQTYGIDEVGAYDMDVTSVGYAGGTPIVTPEPSTYLLLGSGIVGLVLWRRKKVNNQQAAC